MEDSQERARKLRELIPEQPYDSVADLRERAKRFAAEAAQREADRIAQEEFQKNRQRAHEMEAKRLEDETRAALLLRVMRAEQEREERAKLQAEASLGPPSPSYRNEQLELEQEAGRRALAKHRGERVASAEKETGKDSTPGFKP